MLLPYYKEGVVEVGCDEAGRGCLAGPVYAAAVILPPDYHNDLLNDSKQLSEKRRNELRTIIEREALAWAVGIVDNHEIDQINILNASILPCTARWTSCRCGRRKSSLTATASSPTETFPTPP